MAEPANVTPIHLKGNRISLRTPIPEDDEKLCQLFSDPMNMKYLWFLSKLPKGWTVPEMAARRRAQVQNQGSSACVLYVVDNDTNEVIGSSGFPIIDLNNKNGKFGILIDHSRWRGGHGTEALFLSLQYGFEILKLHRIVGETCEPNNSMRKLFERFGFVLEAVRKESMLLNDGFVDGYDYVLLEQDWIQAKEKFVEYLTRKSSAEIPS